MLFVFKAFLLTTPSLDTFCCDIWQIDLIVKLRVLSFISLWYFNLATQGTKKRYLFFLKVLQALYLDVNIWHPFNLNILSFSYFIIMCDYCTYYDWTLSVIELRIKIYYFIIEVEVKVGLLKQCNKDFCIRLYIYTQFLVCACHVGKHYLDAIKFFVLKLNTLLIITFDIF